MQQKTIAVFGGTGKVGQEFMKLVLASDHRVRALVRDRCRFSPADPSRVEIIEGDATHDGDVAGTVEGADVVASFLGNTARHVHIMNIATDNIMTAAAAQPVPPRCLMISSVGVGGSSSLIKLMLTLIGGRAGFEDYERAEARVRNEASVPTVVIRPYALNDKSATGRYKVLGRTAHFAKPIARADVARFFFDCLRKTPGDKAAEINIGGS